MNSASAITEIRSALASTIETYEPPRRIRFQNLAPFKDEIRGLRSRGAAFSTIAELLKKYSVKVSHETVRRFYREIIEQKTSPRKRKKKKQGRTISQPHDGISQEKRPHPTKAGHGPRIARIEDL